MKAKLVITLLAMLVGLVIAALGQTPAPPPVKDYKPTHEQSLELENLQLKAQIAQRDLQAVQQRFQQTLADLTAKAEQVKKDNKWDAKTQFDPNNLSFSAPPPEPPKPAPEKKP